MAAAYDNFDYPSYWIGRDYEHKAEIFALKTLLSKIHKVKSILEVGAGFGRLVRTYSFRAKKILVSDPSSRLLKIAREEYGGRKNIKFIHASLEGLSTKLRASSIDLLILVRVIHHLKDINASFSQIARLIMPGGYLILEFPNKNHLKANISQFLKGNFTFLLDIFPKDLRGRRALRENALPFINYHPDKIREILNENGFKVIEFLSVSNLRTSFLKKIISTEALLWIEGFLQKPLSYIWFGPSIFILAKKEV